MALPAQFTVECDRVRTLEVLICKMGLQRHLQFISRTIFVQNNDVDKACRTLNRILSQEDIFGQYRRTRYYEKPTYVRRRINFERCKSIYNEDMDRKIKFLLRKNRIDPFPGAS
ncbi:28S ribosomal protein S21, mitochondrial isoform X1 [Solenopsis invicta]|uniref:28S ribosomal protein S21, mitochondrial isoform X1 n=2 Tax=Solenopsis invicta TaxID=13686 RepID=UPI000595C55A|nr:28S ribosomal protein S21, mitochondrial isoform X1 [Solenopsis invicta]